MSEISRRQFAAYAVAVVLVVMLGGRALRTDGASTEPGGAAAPGAFSAGAAAAAGGVAGGRGDGGATGARGVQISATSDRPLVHVAGAVRHPGVYELRAGARIQDALRKAGGGVGRADLDVLNLAAKVTDGQQILVAKRTLRGAAAAPTAPVSGASSAAAPASKGSAAAGGTAAAAVNVNSADAIQLELLNGVGPAIAAKIIDWRTEHGPFRTVDDLAQVSGIGAKKLEAMRAQVVT